MSKYRTIQMRDWISRPFKLFKLLTLTSETINSIVKIIYIFTHSNNKIGYEKKNCLYLLYLITYAFLKRYEKMLNMFHKKKTNLNNQNSNFTAK